MSFPDPSQLHEAFAQALASKDVDALLDLYEPGAVVFLPDGGQVTGRGALSAMFTGIIAAGSTTGGTQRTTLVTGDVALTSTTYPGQDARPDGTPAGVTTAEVSHRQDDGTWRVVIDAPTFSAGPTS